MFKKIALAVFISLFSVVAQASFCAEVENLARAIMENRQSGVPLGKVLDNTEMELGKSLALDAYERPHFETQEYKRQAINEFGNDVRLKCEKA